MRMKEAVDEEQASEPKHRFCTTKWTRQPEEVGQGVAVEVTAPSFSRLVIRRAKVVMGQLRAVPVGPHQPVRPPRPNARA